jgi:hypothetical protein
LPRIILRLVGQDRDAILEPPELNPIVFLCGGPDGRVDCGAFPSKIPDVGLENAWPNLGGPFTPYESEIVLYSGEPNERLAQRTIAPRVLVGD